MLPAPRSAQPWGQRVEELLADPGVLIGYFYWGDEADTEPDEGPPFHTPVDRLRQLLGAGFELVVDQGVEASADVFADGERWHVWRRIG